MSDAVHWTVIWTARLTAAAYCVSILLPRGHFRTLQSRKALIAWTIGCLALHVHALAAFHYVHNWSHSQAFAHTRAQTEQVTGWSWGGGLWINYLFLAWWTCDAVVRWTRFSSGAQFSPLYDRVVQIAWAFIFINATMVFGPRWWFWAGLLISLLWAYGIRNHSVKSHVPRSLVCNADVNHSTADQTPHGATSDARPDERPAAERA